MVSLVEHAEDGRTQAATSWLLAESVVVALVGIALAAQALPDGEFPPGLLRAQAPTFAAAAATILAVGAARPSPIILVSAVSVVLALSWLRLFTLYLAGRAIPGPRPGGGRAGVSDWQVRDIPHGCG